MSESDTSSPCCRRCSFWAPNLEGEEASEGVCRRLAGKPTYYGSLITEADDRCEEWERLGVYRDAEGQAHEDRRQGLRNRINLRAHIQTPSGERPVCMVDISEFGAGIGLDNPPAVGARGALKWGFYDVAFTVTWSNESSCGVVFDAPISSELVLETTRRGALKNNRSAEPSRIALGHKRSALGRAV